MNTPCCQSLKSNRLVVSEYEVPKVLSSQKWEVFFETLCTYCIFQCLFSTVSRCVLRGQNFNIV